MSKDRDTQTDRNKTGSVPDRAKTDKNWEDAVKDAQTKKHPKRDGLSQVRKNGGAVEIYLEWHPKGERL
jgi:hypothetical protein